MDELISGREDLFLGGYWSRRRESIEECTARLLRCLLDLAVLDPLLSSWFHLQRRRSSPRVPLIVNEEALETELLKGRHRRDTDRTVMEDLGFGIRVWSGDLDNTVGFSASCGLYTDVKDLVNSVILNYPLLSRGSQSLYSRRVSQALFSVVVQTWDVDWAYLGTDTMREDQHACATGSPYVGWMTNFADRRGVVPDLPSPFEVHKLQTGSLIVAGEQIPEGPDVLFDLRERLGSLITAPWR